MDADELATCTPISNRGSPLLRLNSEALFAGARVWSGSGVRQGSLFGSKGSRGFSMRNGSRKPTSSAVASL